MYLTLYSLFFTLLLTDLSFQKLLSVQVKEQIGSIVCISQISAPRIGPVTGYTALSMMGTMVVEGNPRMDDADKRPIDAILEELRDGKAIAEPLDEPMDRERFDQEIRRIERDREIYRSGRIPNLATFERGSSFDEDMRRRLGQRGDRNLFAHQWFQQPRGDGHLIGQNRGSMGRGVA